MIRQAEMEDIKAMMSIIELNPDTFSKIEIAEAERNIRDSIRKQNKEHRFFVATISGRIVGCGGFSKQNETDGVYQLCWLAVHPDFKRGGIATELYNFIESGVRKLGARLIIAYAGSGEANRYFYRKIGFIEGGRIPKYYTETKD